MKYLIITLMSLNLNTAFASITPGGETVGGPFTGKCQINNGDLPKQELHFDIKPNTKIGARLDDGRKRSAIFVQVINDSFNNSLSVAIVNSNSVLTNPPRFCIIFGPYNQCDYIKPEPFIPSMPDNSDETLRFEALIGTLKFEESPNYFGYESKVSDAWTEVISERNQGFEDKVLLRIDEKRTLKCDLKYSNLF